MIVVFDTNIYIAAFYSRGFLYQLLLKTLDHGSGHSVYFSGSIRAEILEKLKEEFTTDEINKITSVIDEFVYLVEPAEKVAAIKDDPDDNKILECAVAAEANLIVTMDKHLLKLKVFRKIAIVHPKTFKFMFPK